MSLTAESGKKLPLESGAGKKLPFAGLLSQLDVFSRGIRPLHLFLLLLGLFFANFPGVFVGLDSLFYRDFGVFGAPLASYHRQVFWQGELPLWNPLNNCGLPFAAQWNTMVFYPFSLVYLLLPFPWSLNMFCLGHAAFAGISMYWLARWWLGKSNSFAAALAGLAYAWNGFTLHALMWPNNIAAYAWMPLVILMVQRATCRGSGDIFGAALIGAIQMLTGAPEIIVFTWGISGVLLLVKSVAPAAAQDPGFASRLTAPSEWGRALTRFMMVFVLVLALSAIQLLPFLDLVTLSQRNRNFGGDAWSLPAWGLANFFVPLFRSTPSRLNVYSQDEQQWTSSYYVGIGVMLLALLALWKARDARVRVLGCLLLGSLWLAFGRDGWLYSLVNQIVPVLGFVRFPVKFAVIALFTLALLAGQGAAWISGQKPAAVQRNAAFGTILIAALCLLVLLVAFRYPFPQDSWSATWKSGCSRILFLGLMGAGLVLRSRLQGRSAVAVSCGLLLCMGFDIWTHAPPQNPVVPTFSYTPGQPPSSAPSRFMLLPAFKTFMSQASTESPLENWKGLRASKYSDCNLLDGISKTDGFYSLYLKEEAQLRDRLDHAPKLATLPILDFLSVERISAPDVLFAWQHRPAFLPLVTAGQQPVFASQQEVLEQITSPGFQPSSRVFLPKAACPAQDVTWGDKPHITELHVGREKITFNANSEKPAWVVIAQAFHPAWKLKIDGKPQRLHKANFAFQAFPLPAGAHDVSLVYADSRLLWGALISLSTLGLCVTGALIYRTKAVQPTLNMMPVSSANS